MKGSGYFPMLWRYLVKGEVVQVIFDFDGTLCDSFYEGAKVMNGLAEEFKFRNVGLDQLDSLRGLTSREILKHLDISLYRLPFVVRRVRREMEAKMDSLKPIAGMPEVVRKLAEGGVRLGILSSNSVENVRRFVDKNGMNHFEFIEAGSSIFGKAKFLNQIVKKRGLDVGSTYYVGDEQRDVEASRAANLKSIAVSWGFNSRVLLEKERPNYLFDKPDEFLKLF